MNTKVIGIVVGVVVVLVGLWLFYGDFGVTSETRAIKIGFIGPLTGEAAAYGEPAQKGVQLAVDEINKQGGVDGRSVEVIYEDGQCKGEFAASAAQKLIKVDGVRYIIGGGCSSEAFSFVPIADQSKVFVISAVSSAPKLKGISPFFVRNNPSDNEPATALASFLAKTHKRMAIISEKTDYNQGLKPVFIAQAEKDGATIVSAEDYDSTTTDFRTLLTKVKQVNPDVIVVNSQTSANLIRISDQARQLDLTMQLASPGPFTDEQVLADKNLDGTIFALAPGLSTEGKGPTFLENYKRVYGKEPQYAFYAGAAYDDVYLIAQAIREVGDDSEKVAEYIYALENFEGTIGTYSFDEGGDLIGVTSILQKIVNGKVITL